MDTSDLCGTLTTLFGELADGPSAQAPHMLNRGDLGLRRSLDRLTAGQASVAPAGGASIAAHTDHLRYGLSLLNRWSAGESPFDAADWNASWKMTSVSDAEWLQLRNALRAEVRRWFDVLGTPREMRPTELGDMIGSIAHFAYHLGAIRQIDRAARGPAERPSDTATRTG
jgi:hypothetical protein